MKCLVINGASHKGNTWKLTELVKSCLLTLDTTIEFEEIHLKDINLPFCLGCSLCFRKGHTYCPHHEIMQIIMDKIDECDGVLFTATTNNMQMPALTKNLVDHLCFMLHRPRYFDKKALIISTTGGVGAKSATKYMAGTMVGWGFNRCYQLPITTISWNDYQPTEKHKRKSLKVAKRFYSDLASKKLHPPSVAALIPYNLFRGMSYDYQKGTEYEMYDGTFWEESGLIHEAYSPTVPLPIHKKLLGNFFCWFARRISKSMIVTYKK